MIREEKEDISLKRTKWFFLWLLKGEEKHHFMRKNVSKKQEEEQE